MLVDGVWTKDWDPVQAKDEDGRFVRQVSSFRNWVTPDGAAGPTGEAGFAAEPGRYHLYIALICPWAHRAYLTLKLKGLEDVISLSIVEPALTDQGWRFGDYPGSTGADDLLGATYMHEIYTHSDPSFTGRATVPVLWDKKTRRIVNNESADIVKILNDAFNAFATNDIDLRPDDIVAEIDALSPRLYDALNNGVYKSGFASTQGAYEEAVSGVFAMLDELEARLGDGGPFLFGERLTESDIRLFVTLARFDAAYHGVFKCNIRRITDYPALSTFLRGFVDFDPAIRETISIDHIKAGYYSIKALNPNGVIPVGPAEPAFLTA